MLSLILYLLAIFLLILFLIGMIIYTLSLLYSSWMGSPYIPTKQKELDYFLKEANLKSGKLFVELGCGDGRVVRTAVSKYGVKGVGIDVNPVIVRWARFKTNFHKTKNIEFRVENIYKTNLSKIDYIYIFLMPDIINKLKKKLEKELNNNSIVISHGFDIKGWESYLYKKISHAPFPTYFYRYRKDLYTYLTGGLSFDRLQGSRV